MNQCEHCKTWRREHQLTPHETADGLNWICIQCTDSTCDLTMEMCEWCCIWRPRYQLVIYQTSKGVFPGCTSCPQLLHDPLPMSPEHSTLPERKQSSCAPFFSAMPPLLSSNDFFAGELVLSCPFSCPVDNIMARSIKKMSKQPTEDDICIVCFGDENLYELCCHKIENAVPHLFCVNCIVDLQDRANNNIIENYMLVNNYEYDVDEEYEEPVLYGIYD